MDFVDVADFKPEALCREPEQGIQRVRTASRGHGRGARKNRARWAPGGVGADGEGEVARGLAWKFQVGQDKRAFVLPLAWRCCLRRRASHFRIMVILWIGTFWFSQPAIHDDRRRECRCGSD